MRFAFRLGPTTFWIFDAIADEPGRTARLEGEIAKALMTKADERPPLSFEVQRLKQELVRHRDGARARLESPLREDHPRELFGDVDVRGLKRAPDQRPATTALAHRIGGCSRCLPSCLRRHRRRVHASRSSSRVVRWCSLTLTCRARRHGTFQWTSGAHRCGRMADSHPPYR